MTQKPRFEDHLKALEALVTQLEEGDMPLEAALEAHSKGVALVKACEDMLALAENQVKMLGETA